MNSNNVSADEVLKDGIETSIDLLKVFKNHTDSLSEVIEILTLALENKSQRTIIMNLLSSFAKNNKG